MSQNPYLPWVVGRNSASSPGLKWPILVAQPGFFGLRFSTYLPGQVASLSIMQGARKDAPLRAMWLVCHAGG
ncbi:unnamed protein product [Amoebophrya sp. A120]|nr:unnamed protein product [Amoebophrya sp. A120]|eukprot:GSA120T00000620001.1